MLKEKITERNQDNRCDKMSYGYQLVRDTEINLLCEILERNPETGEK
jgi:hypothetical protein